MLLHEIKKLTAENEELKNKINYIKKDKESSAGSENNFIQVRNHNQHCQGGTALPRELIYQTRQFLLMNPLPLLKFAGKACTKKDYDVRCYPGIRLEELRHQVEEIY